jgi:hypothetical protein
MEEAGLQVSRKTILVVLFVPSVERDGVTMINQESWVQAALEYWDSCLAEPRLFRGPWAFGATTNGAACWSRITRSSFTVTQLPPTFPIRTASSSLETSAAAWGARRGKVKSGS